MRFSILVCTIACRRDFLRRLLAVLDPQIGEAADQVELLIDSDDGQVPIGVKRNRLVARAAGDYLAFIDDDDLVAPDYVARILKALESNPDCVTFRGRRYRDGELVGDTLFSRNIPRNAEREPTVADRVRYLRMPNHLCPMKAGIVRRVPFAQINRGEDTHFAKRIHRLLKTEVFICAPLYFYYFRSFENRRETTNAVREQVQETQRVSMIATLSSAAGVFLRGKAYDVPAATARRRLSRGLAGNAGGVG